MHCQMLVMQIDPRYCYYNRWRNDNIATVFISDFPFIKGTNHDLILTLWRKMCQMH